MNNQSILGGANIYLAPLISFDTIVDTDFGLINLIGKEYLDESVFNVDFFKKNVKQIIKEIYLREDKNPLYLIAKDGQNKELLDEYYAEFMSSKLIDVYNNSITTEILHLIASFNNSPNITTPDILCYNNEQIEILKNEPLLEKNNKILLSDLEKDNYGQFFFKDIDDCELFKDLTFKSFYVSTYGPNLDKNEDDLRNQELVDTLIKNKNSISIFDIYKQNILGRK